MSEVSGVSPENSNFSPDSIEARTQANFEETIGLARDLQRAVGIGKAFDSILFVPPDGSGFSAELVGLMALNRGRDGRDLYTWDVYTVSKTVRISSRRVGGDVINNVPASLGFDVLRAETDPENGKHEWMPADTTERYWASLVMKAADKDPIITSQRQEDINRRRNQPTMFAKLRNLGHFTRYKATSGDHN